MYEWDATLLGDLLGEQTRGPIVGVDDLVSSTLSHVTIELRNELIHQRWDIALTHTFVRLCMEVSYAHPWSEINDIW